MNVPNYYKKMGVKLTPTPTNYQLELQGKQDQYTLYYSEPDVIVEVDKRSFKGGAGETAEHYILIARLLKGHRAHASRLC